MVDDRDKDSPSLEPPSLFGRKKKKAAAPLARTPPPVDDVAPVETRADAPVVEPPVSASVVAPLETRVEPPVDTPVEAPVDTRVETPVEPPVDTRVETPVEPPVDVPVETPVEPAVEVTPSAPVADDSPTTIFDEPAEPVASPLTPPPAPAPKEPREPWATGPLAAGLVGLLVGAIIVGATAGSQRVCTEVKGTSSCGGPGFFMLVAILVVATLVGAALLRAARVPEAGSTSFLAVGLLSVVALLFLIDELFDWWMIIVIPIVSVATFLLSHWVTTTYIDPSNDSSDPDRQPEPHDVR